MKLLFYLIFLSLFLRGPMSTGSKFSNAELSNTIIQIHKTNDLAVILIMYSTYLQVTLFFQLTLCFNYSHETQFWC